MALKLRCLQRYGAGKVRSLDRGSGRINSPEQHSRERQPSEGGETCVSRGTRHQELYLARDGVAIPPSL